MDFVLQKSSDGAIDLPSALKHHNALELQTALEKKMPVGAAAVVPMAYQLFMPSNAVASIVGLSMRYFKQGLQNSWAELAKGEWKKAASEVYRATAGFIAAS